MSRMENKKKLRKNTRYLNFLLLILFILLISGIFATDYILKEMMALFNGGQLFAYQRQGNLHNFEIFGDQYCIDQKQVYGNLKATIQWGRLHLGNTIEVLKELIIKMSG